MPHFEQTMSAYGPQPQNPHIRRIPKADGQLKKLNDYYRPIADKLRRAVNDSIGVNFRR